VKPANIMLDLEGKAKLVDLGLAKQVPDPDLSYRASEPSRGFQRGSGTPLYMAPEQAQGASPDLRSDIYALGVTLYEGLTGALPPHPDSNQSVAKMLRALRSEVPLELALLVQRMLSRDPVNRPDGYKELHRQLRQIRRSLPKEESWPETRQATV
jgi:serine/threonine protein kinase